MNRILNNWNAMRLVRLLLGVSIIAQGARTGEWIFMGAGVVFTLMPLLNVGCCATGNCTVPIKKKRTTRAE